MNQLGNIRAGMTVLGADDIMVGYVEGVTHHHIRLRPTGVRGAEGFVAHLVPAGLIAAIEGDIVRLSANADVAAGFEEPA